MAVSSGTVPFLVAMMLLTGVCNTLVTKFQVRTERIASGAMEGFVPQTRPSLIRVT